MSLLRPLMAGVLLLSVSISARGPPNGTVGTIDFRYPDYIVEPLVDCPFEGYFPHPRDNTWFYRCYDRYGSSFFWRAYFQCQPCTVFSDALDQCVYWETGAQCHPPAEPCRKTFEDCRLVGICPAANSNRASLVSVEACFKTTLQCPGQSNKPLCQDGYVFDRTNDRCRVGSPNLPCLLDAPPTLTPFPPPTTIDPIPTPIPTTTTTVSTHVPPVTTTPLPTTTCELDRSRLTAEGYPILGCSERQFCSNDGFKLAPITGCQFYLKCDFTATGALQLVRKQCPAGQFFFYGNVNQCGGQGQLGWYDCPVLTEAPPSPTTTSDTPLIPSPVTTTTLATTTPETPPPSTTTSPAPTPFYTTTTTTSDPTPTPPPVTTTTPATTTTTSDHPPTPPPVTTTTPATTTTTSDPPPTPPPATTTTPPTTTPEITPLSTTTSPVLEPLSTTTTTAPTTTERNPTPYGSHNNMRECEQAASNMIVEGFVIKCPEMKFCTNDGSTMVSVNGCKSYLECQPSAPNEIKLFHKFCREGQFDFGDSKSCRSKDQFDLYNCPASRKAPPNPITSYNSPPTSPPAPHTTPATTISERTPTGIDDYIDNFFVCELAGSRPSAEGYRTLGCSERQFCNSNGLPLAPITGCQFYLECDLTLLGGLQLVHRKCPAGQFFIYGNVNQCGGQGQHVCRRNITSYVGSNLMRQTPALFSPYTSVPVNQARPQSAQQHPHSTFTYDHAAVSPQHPFRFPHNAILV